MKTNLLKTIFHLGLLVVCFVCLTGCNNKPTNTKDSSSSGEHTHTFSSEWTYDETSHWHVATCEHDDKVTSFSAHQWNGGVVTKEATEETEGEKTFTCIICKYTKVEIINKVSHVFNQQNIDNKYVANEADCLNPTTYYYSCACGEKGTETFTYGRALGHSFTNYKSNNDATCGKDGTKTAKCDRCDEKETITDVGSKLDHTYSNAWTTDETYHWHSATCEHTTEVKDKAIHTWNDGVVTRPATDKEEGVTTYTCTVCGKTKEVKIDITVHNHAYSEWEYKDDGVHIRTCSCGDVQTEYHEEDEEKTTTTITEDYEIIETVICKTCRHKFEIDMGFVTYSVIFSDENDAVISAIEFKAGTTVEVVAPTTPEKLNKRFIGWDTNIGEINTATLKGDVIIKTQYTNEYTIIFYDKDGDEIKRVKYAPNVDETTSVEYPILEQIEGYTASWSMSKEDLKSITNDVSVVPIYEINSYVVNFYDYDERLLSTQDVIYKLSAKAPLNVTKWYYDNAKYVGQKFKGWKAITKDKKEISIESNDNWDGIITGITENLDFRPYYTEGCDNPTLVLSLNNENKIDISILIPYGYNLVTMSFKIEYDMNVYTMNNVFEDSILVDNRQVTEEEKRSKFEKNLNSQYFSYYFISNLDAKSCIEIDSNKRYRIMNVEFKDKNGDVVDFRDKDLSSIFTLVESESNIIFRVGESEYKTESITIVFDKGERE